MKTTTTAGSRTRRLIALVVEFRNQVAEVKKGGIVDRDEIAVEVAKRTRELAHAHFDDLHRNFIEVNAMSDKRARKRFGLEIDTGQFVLTELFEIHHKTQTLYLRRGELMLADGDRITLQKQSNINAALQAKKDWDFEWGKVIRPVLVKHQKWTYERAYRYVLRHGGIPLEEDEDDEVAT